MGMDIRIPKQFMGLDRNKYKIECSDDKIVITQKKEDEKIFYLNLRDIYTREDEYFPLNNHALIALREYENNQPIFVHMIETDNDYKDRTYDCGGIVECKLKYYEYDIDERRYTGKRLLKGNFLDINYKDKYYFNNIETVSKYSPSLMQQDIYNIGNKLYDILAKKLNEGRDIKILFDRDLFPDEVSKLRDILHVYGLAKLNNSSEDIYDVCAFDIINLAVWMVVLYIRFGASIFIQNKDINFIYNNFIALCPNYFVTSRDMRKLESYKTTVSFDDNKKLIFDDYV